MALPAPFNGSTAEEFDNWLWLYECYAKSIELHKKEGDIQVAHLLSTMGPQVQLIYQTFRRDERTNDPSLLKDLFRSYYYNLLNSRFQFYSVKQDGRNIDEYVQTLRLYAELCNFGSLIDQHIMDQFIVGLDNKDLQEELLWHTPYLNLQTAIRLCRGQTWE